YTWIHVNDSTSRYSQQIADYLEGVSNSTITIPANLIDVGVFKFELKVSDIFGQISTKRISITKKNDDNLPITTILGETHRNVYRKDEFFIEGFGSFSPCASTKGKKLKYSWTSSDPNLQLGPSKNTPKLFIESYLLNVGKNYTFQLKVSVINIETEEEISSSSAS